MAAEFLGLEGVELLAHGAEGKTSRVPAAEALAGKHVGIYFSAHWCPPCRSFTPMLADVYGKLQHRGDDFEVIFCSLDQRQFQDYFGSMPWLAIPFEQGAQRTQLKDQFGVEGIPRLVIIGPGGEVVSGNAVTAVRADTTGAQFPWPRAADDIGRGLFGLVAPREILVLMLIAYMLYEYFTRRV